MKTRRSGSAAFGLLLLAGLSACSAIVGIKDLPTTEDGESSGGGGSGSGGSGSGGSGSDKELRFVGTWTLTTGSNSSLCNGTTSTYTDTGTLTVIRGTTTDLLMTPPNGCTYGANVTSGNVATLLSGQSCSGSQNGIDVVFYPSGTFTIDSAGTTGEVKIGGTLDAENAQGQTEQCTFTQDDDYARE